jgi:hypothetical protein
VWCVIVYQQFYNYDGVIFSILSCFRFKLSFVDRYRDIFVRIYPFSMDWILLTVFRFRLSHFRYRANKNLYQWKWWEGFPDHFYPYLESSHPLFTQSFSLFPHMWPAGFFVLLVVYGCNTSYYKNSNHLL